MRTSAAPVPARDDLLDRERERYELAPCDVDGARRQDREARAAEHPEGAKQSMVKRCEGDGEWRKAGAGARPDVGDSEVQDDDEGQKKTKTAPLKGLPARRGTTARPTTLSGTQAFWWRRRRATEQHLDERVVLLEEDLDVRDLREQCGLWILWR